MKLDDEIDELVKQIPFIPDVEDIENWFNEDLVFLERDCLRELLNRNITKDNIHDYIRHEQITPPVQSLYMKGWGLLQPSIINSPFGQEKSGINLVKKERSFVNRKEGFDYQTRTYSPFEF